MLEASLFAAYVAASSLGLLLIKEAAGHLSLTHISAALLREAGTGALLSGALLYGASFLLWICILSRVPLATAYPLAIGLTLLFTTLGAVFILGERPTIATIVGGAVVFVGVTMTIIGQK